jgi:hypothetical protein
VFRGQAKERAHLGLLAMREGVDERKGVGVRCRKLGRERRGGEGSEKKRRKKPGKSKEANRRESVVEAEGGKAVQPLNEHVAVSDRGGAALE